MEYDPMEIHSMDNSMALFMAESMAFFMAESMASFMADSMADSMTIMKTLKNIPN